MFGASKLENTKNLFSKDYQQNNDNQSSLFFNNNQQSNSNKLSSLFKNFKPNINNRQNTSLFGTNNTLFPRYDNYPILFPRILI